MQGTTWRGRTDQPFDLGLFGNTPVGEALERWRRLRHAADASEVVHSLQVHGREIRQHPGADEGVRILHGYDGHSSAVPGLLLTVSVADCVPISLVDPERQRIALLHGGWRGTAAGILHHGLAALDADVHRVRVHLGPAICGPCYEVGPEVHEELGLPRPDSNRPVDVRAVQARQALEAGVPPENITVSRHCTRCGDRFFSHRAGSPGRQLGVLGIRS